MALTKSKPVTRSQYAALSSVFLVFTVSFLMLAVLLSPLYYIAAGAFLISAIVFFSLYMRKYEEAKPAPDLPPVPENE